MIEAGVRKIRLLDPKYLVRKGRTLAKSYVPPEELGPGASSFSENLLVKVDRWVVDKSSSGGMVGDLLRKHVHPVLLSDKVDPALKAELVKAGAAAEAKGLWRRLEGWFGPHRTVLKNGQPQVGVVTRVQRLLKTGTPEGRFDAFLVKLYGEGASARQENARSAVAAFRSMVSTAGGYGNGPELDALVRSALTTPGKISVPAKYRAGFVARQIAELRLSLLLGERGSAGSLVQIRRDLGIRADLGSIAAVAEKTRSGEEFADGLRRLMARQPDAKQQALIQDLADKLDRLYRTALQAL